MLINSDLIPVRHASGSATTRCNGCYLFRAPAKTICVIAGKTTKNIRDFLVLIIFSSSATSLLMPVERRKITSEGYWLGHNFRVVPVQNIFDRIGCGIISVRKISDLRKHFMDSSLPAGIHTGGLTVTPSLWPLVGPRGAECYYISQGKLCCQLHAPRNRAPLLQRRLYRNAP